MLVVVSDLFFLARIRATASALGVAIEEATVASAHERCAAAPPALLILDLHAAGDPLAQVRRLKAEAGTRRVPVVGFYSHVDNATRAAALEAGVDRVLPRSAFTAKLAEILGGG